ncbi:hypothetical protein Bbelb_364960 [Branchiostoma belcheri]|nr:hypothetical protein Bbelb_364960 [Branchiostoma belcheri]
MSGRQQHVLKVGSTDRGRFGTVYLCEDKTTRRRFAAKYVRCRRSADRQSINHEIEIMNQLRHPRILQLYDAFDCGKEVAMIMELITGGELFQLVADEAVELSEKACVSYVRQLCEAVSYMHEQNILHLDLKVGHVLEHLRFFLKTVELSEKACVSYVRQLCEAVSYMHEQNILHLDLKVGHVLEHLRFFLKTVELSEKACVSYVRQLCEAVSYMHEQNILHLDLKVGHVLDSSRVTP